MSAYDLIATQYLAERGRLKSGKYVQKLLKLLPKHSIILDLGCGAGVPVDDVIVAAGHDVVGIDISPKQIELARKYVPRAQYLVGDVMSLNPGEYQVDAVISLYTWFHLPRERQAERLGVVESFLPKGGFLLLTMGDREFEGEHTLHGVKLWSSQYGTAKNRKIVESAGFEVIFEELDNSGGERHQWIIARKK